MEGSHQFKQKITLSNAYLELQIPAVLSNLFFFCQAFGFLQRCLLSLMIQQTVMLQTVIVLSTSLQRRRYVHVA